MDISETLKERGSNYGDFKRQGAFAQILKDEMRVHPNWDNLSGSQREALEMIQHKISRIINGNPNYADNWHDIAGYATLIEKELEDARSAV